MVHHKMIIEEVNIERSANFTVKSRFADSKPKRGKSARILWTVDQAVADNLPAPLGRWSLTSPHPILTDMNSDLSSTA